MQTLIAVHNPKLKEMIFSQEALKRLERISEVHWLEEYGNAGLEEVIADFDACITSWGSPRLTDHVLDKAQRLMFIGHAAGTVVPYVDESVFNREIAVVNANYALSRAAAEGAVAMMAAGAYRLPMYERMLLQGGWADNDSECVPGLFGQKIGLIGYGAISREVIRLLGPYEPDILLYSGYCSREEAESLGIRLCTLEELLAESDIVSLHNTLTSQTRGMLGSREFGMMKEGALFINTARGPIVQEEALIHALEQGKINAILDVYDREPLETDHPFRRLPNVCCFPHVAAYSGYWKKRLGLCVTEDLERLLRGRELRGRITLGQYKRMTPR